MKALKMLGIMLCLSLIIVSCHKYDVDDFPGVGLYDKVDICKDGHIKTVKVYKLERYVDKGWVPLIDQDGDHYVTEENSCGYPVDCDDSDAAINPDAEEICDDGIDNNCNDLIDDLDLEAGCLPYEIFPDRAAFDAVCGGLPVEEFLRESLGASVSCESPINSTNGNCELNALLPGFNVISTPRNILDNWIRGTLAAENSVGSLYNVTDSDGIRTYPDELMITFDNPVSSVGFTLHSAGTDSDIVVDIFDSNGNLITSELMIDVTRFVGSFVGIRSNTPISSIRLNSTSGQAEFISMLSFGACSDNL